MTGGLDKGFFTVPENDDLPSSQTERFRQPSFPERLVRRKQVSQDVFSASEINLFFQPDAKPDEEDPEQMLNDNQDASKLFFPLRFSPRTAGGQGGHGGHGGHGGPKQSNLQEGWQDDGIQYNVPSDDTITKATRRDFIKTGILFILMACFTGVCVGWKTHEDESHSIFGPVGTACVTPCYGDPTYRNFFTAHHDHFHSGDVSAQELLSCSI